jgi:molybdopterin molybdotransferase
MEKGVKKSRAYSRDGNSSCLRVAMPRDCSWVLGSAIKSSSSLIVGRRRSDFNRGARIFVNSDTGFPLLTYNGFVATVTFYEAREMVRSAVREAFSAPPIERVPLEDAAGRVLAEVLRADRDTPPVSRSMRDGFAVRSVDLPGSLEIVGQIRAGERGAAFVGPGQAVEIMTGAPIPDGADAIVMAEHTRREGNRVWIERSVEPHQFITPRGCEATAGEAILHPGQRLDYSGVAALAAFGCSSVPVYRRPVAAIVATGDEIVGVSDTPAEHQVRNSNAYALAAQVSRAGGIPKILAVARDTLEHTREQIRQGLDADLLLLSGGVSAGKYDLVEEVLAEFGARFFFDRVLIQPGQPAVFGAAGGKFFFGLPGNPVSTMVTFEIFARAALELLAGEVDPPPRMPFAKLTCEFHHQTGLTRFLPARLSADGAEVTPVQWHGSGDIPALTRANAYLIADAGRAEYSRGEWIQVLLK